MGSMVFECCVMSTYWKREYQTTVCEMLRDWLISRMKLFGLKRNIIKLKLIVGKKNLLQKIENGTRKLPW